MNTMQMNGIHLDIGCGYGKIQGYVGMDKKI
jgi:hypothetical protein